jgi:hypothetical protein
MAGNNEMKDPITELDISLVEHASDKKIDTAYVLQPVGRPPRKTGLERRLVMKQDCLLIPLLALTYFVTYLVRLFPVSFCHNQMQLAAPFPSVSC